MTQEPTSRKEFVEMKKVLAERIQEGTWEDRKACVAPVCRFSTAGAMMVNGRRSKNILEVGWMMPPSSAGNLLVSKPQMNRHQQAHLILPKKSWSLWEKEPSAKQRLTFRVLTLCQAPVQCFWCIISCNSHYSLNEVGDVVQMLPLRGSSICLWSHQ